MNRFGGKPVFLLLRRVTLGSERAVTVEPLLSNPLTGYCDGE